MPAAAADVVLLLLTFLLLVFSSVQQASTGGASSSDDSPGTSPPRYAEQDEDETLSRQCTEATDSPLLAGGISAPGTAGTTSRNNGGDSNFISALTGVWTSARCEVTPGPEFTYRRYVFYSSPQDQTQPVPPDPNADDKQLSPRVFFRSIHFKFADPFCLSPIFAFNAEGEVVVAQPLSRGLFSATPGSEEADVTVYRVSLTIFNASAFVANNYSVFSLRQSTDLPVKRRDVEKVVDSAEVAYDDEEAAASDADYNRREAKSLRFSSFCEIERLWPHLADQAPKIVNATANNVLLFEMYNDLEPSAEWFQWSPTDRPFSPRQRVSDEAERVRNEDRLECLKKAGFNIDELLLMRIERRLIMFQNVSGPSWPATVSILKTGHIFRGIFGELNYKPAMYQSNVLFQFKPAMAAVCPVCASLAQSNVEDNCYAKFFANVTASSAAPIPPVNVADASFLLPYIWAKPINSTDLYSSTLEKSGRWTSTRCETRNYGIFLKRQLIFSQKSAAIFRGIYLYFEDPFCTIPTYDLEIGGDFRFVRGVFNAQPGMDTAKPSSSPFASAYLFNTNWARIRPHNMQAVTTLSEYSLGGGCGRATAWRLGEWQDVTRTGGCYAIAIRVPTEELQVVRLETSTDGANQASFLYVGDADSKRPLSPSLMLPSAISTTSQAVKRPATSQEVRMSLDYSLFEQIRPTSFLEPLVRCRDLVAMHKANKEKIAPITQPTTAASRKTAATSSRPPRPFVTGNDSPEVVYFQQTVADDQAAFSGGASPDDDERFVDAQSPPETANVVPPSSYKSTTTSPTATTRSPNSLTAQTGGKTKSTRQQQNAGSRQNVKLSSPSSALLLSMLLPLVIFLFY